MVYWEKYCERVSRFEAFSWILIFFAQIAWFEGQATPLLYSLITDLKSKLRKDLLSMFKKMWIILEVIYYRI